MSAKPRIFVSAVSKELGSARQRVANALISLGYEPEFLDVFPAEQGDLTDMLRRKIDSCEGLIQVAGQRFGCGFLQPESAKAAVSYTQFEMHYARERGIKTWPIILAEHYPADEPNEESEAHRQNQQRYRRSLASSTSNDGLGSLLYHEAGTPAELENVVLKLRDELDILRAQWRRDQRRTFVIIATTAVCVILLLVMVSFYGRYTGQTLDTTTRVEKKLDQTQFALSEVIRLLPIESRESELDNDEATRSALFSAREKKHGLAPGTIARELPVYANRLAADSAATPVRRAMGAYAARDYLEAERLALQAAAEARKAVPPNRAQLMQALELAGRSASARRDFDKATTCYTEAASLADKARDAGEYARLHQALIITRSNAITARLALVSKPAFNAPVTPDGGSPLTLAPDSQGKIVEPETPLQSGAVAAFSQSIGGGGQRDETASTRPGGSSRTGTAAPRDKPTPEEGELQAGGKGETFTLASDTRETLAPRSSAVAQLLAEGKAAQAETEYRTVLKLSEQTLGAENSETLSNRTQLALALSAQHKFAEAETEHRAVLSSRVRLLGPSHADTLYSRTKLGETLHNRHFFPEAEEEHRAVLDIREKDKNFGPEHPDTSQSRENLAAALIEQSKFAQAEAQIRLVLGIRERNLGPDNANTLSSRTSLGKILFAQAKYFEAEKEYRTVIRILERLPVSRDLEMLKVRKDLVRVLDYQRKFQQAEQEHRTIVAGCQKTHGTQDTNTLVSMHDLALFLESQRKFEEAFEWAEQAARGARTAWGFTNSVTKEYEQHEQKLKGRR